VNGRDDDFGTLDGRVASLTAALLARKGAASPSLKRFRASADNPYTAGGACSAARQQAETCPRRPNPRRAAVTVRLTVPEFLRLKLGSAQLGLTSQAILAEAVARYLDQEGVETLAECPCLKRAADGGEK
jgi:hypothetical protein